MVLGASGATASTAHKLTFGRHSYNRVGYFVVAVIVVIAITSSLTWVVPMLVGVGANLVSPQQLVIIDTDPGIDDAVAIITTLADPKVKVLAITCVRGNSDVPNVVINALKILLVAKAYGVPVFTSYNYNLLVNRATDNWFGKDGLGDLPFTNPPPASNAMQEHAASFLARIVREYPGEITLITIGPLTNIALALHLNPGFLQLTKRVIVLGGSIRGYGNVSPGVEFNFHMDPDAAALVLERALATKAPVTLMPMETVIENDLTLDWRWNVLGKINNPVMDFINAMEKKQQQMHSATKYHPFDAYAVSISLCPDFVSQTREWYGFVENKGERTMGSLVIDYMNLTSNMANLEVVVEVNTTVIKQMMYENLSSFT